MRLRGPSTPPAQGPGGRLWQNLDGARHDVTLGIAVVEDPFHDPRVIRPFKNRSEPASSSPPPEASRAPTVRVPECAQARQRGPVSH
jgi:hypothetical protein